MKTALAPLVFFALVASALADEVQVYFSPARNGQQSCREVIVNAVNDATVSILVEEYSFTKGAIRIADALIDASKKTPKVKVVVLLNYDKENFAVAKHLVDNGVAVRMSRPNQTNHNKVIVIDGEKVITGSYNFSNNAEHHNRENLVVIKGKDTAQRFADDWQDNFADSDADWQKRTP